MNEPVKRPYRRSGLYVSGLTPEEPWRMRRHEADAPALATVARANATAARRHRAGPPGGRSPKRGAAAREASSPILDVVCHFLDAGARALLSAGTGAVTPRSTPTGAISRLLKPLGFALTGEIRVLES
jgi:hypothetical protein